MPEISRFHGIAIYIYFEMSARHHEPHFHAVYGEYDASFSIAPPMSMAGHQPTLPPRLVLAWAELHQVELLDNWQRAMMGRPLRPIVGPQ